MSVVAQDAVAEVIYEGSKFFWRTRNTVDIVVVLHAELQILEIVAYEPNLDVEAPRIYLNRNILDSMLDQNEINAKIRFAQQNNVPTTERFVQGLWNTAINDFLLPRVGVHFSEDNSFHAEVQLRTAELNTGLICLKPVCLQPYPVKHYRQIK